MVSLSLAKLPGDDELLVLAAGGLDHKIHLYCNDATGKLISRQNHTHMETSLACFYHAHTGKMFIIDSSYIEGPVLIAGSKSYEVSLESLLLAHEDWVYYVQWQPSKTDCEQTMCILSASMDKTMMIWRPEKTTGMWVNMMTVGELSHTALGFYGGHWAPDGNSILAHGYGGSFHLWTNDGAEYENRIPQKVLSGHFASVSDIAWAKSDAYLLSVSHD